MKKKSYLKYGHPFDNGGWRTNWGTVDEQGNFTSDFGGKGLGTTLGMASGAASLFSSAYKMATPDTETMLKSVDNEIEALDNNKKKIESSSLDDLIAQWSDWKALDTDFKAKDYYIGPSDGDIATGAISSTLSGAATGAAAGPWGALAGAIIGLGSGLIGGFTGKSKAEEAAEEAAAKRRRAAKEYNEYQQASFTNAVRSLTSKNNRMLASQIAAYGGPLGISLLPVSGAIDYMQNEELLSSLGENMTKNNNSRTSMPTFAFGGALPGYGGDWSNGLNFIKAGKRHEQNPIGGVPMGVAQDGVPNLVEEGEVVWNDYVFSNRIGVPKSVREKFQLKGGDNMTFAEAVEKAQKASAERPNDPIEKRTLDTLLAGLMQEQETIRQEKAQKEQFSQMEDMAAFAADGGPIHIAKNKRGTFTAAATKHGMGVQEFAGHVLANKDKYSPAMVKKANFARDAAKWHALGGHLFYDGGIKPWEVGFLYDNNIAQHTDENNNPIDPWGDTPYPLRVQSTSKPEETNTALPTSGWQTMLRYAPVVGGIGTVFSDLMGWTNKPDYQYADAIDAAAERATSGYTHVSPTMLGDYLAYNPFDRLFYANELGAQQAATRRGILNLSNGNRGTALAGLLAADYSGNIGLGKLFREGEEYNLAQRQKVAEFNRATNMYNSEADLKAQIANAEMDRARANLLYEAALKSNLMRQQEDQTSAAAKAANLTSLFDNLGNLGIDAYNRYDRNALINAGIFGTLSQKPQGVSDADWEEYQKYFRKIYGRAEGGKLRKKKKGLTI